MLQNGFGDDFAADIRALHERRINTEDDALAKSRRSNRAIRWVDEVLDGVLRDPEPLRVTRSDRLDRVLDTPAVGQPGLLLC